MKKARFLTAALAAAMITMGAGYAAWTDSVTITNKVNTGTFDVAFQGATGKMQDGNLEVGKVAATASGDDAQITLENVYPGATATIELPIKNIGTIPVKDGKITFTQVPAWLTVNTVQAPVLQVNETKTVTITMTVGEDAPESQSNVQFTGTATYQQFNK